MRKSYIQDKIDSFWFDAIKEEFMNTPQFKFMTKYQTSCRTCQKLFWYKKKHNKPLKELEQESYNKINDKRILNTNKWEYIEYVPKYEWQIVEKKWIPWIKFNYNY